MANFSNSLSAASAQPQTTAPEAPTGIQTTTVTPTTPVTTTTTSTVTKFIDANRSMLTWVVVIIVVIAGGFWLSKSKMFKD